MNPFTHNLDSIRRTLTSDAESLEQIWQNHPLLWQQQGWTQHQLRLWLGCLPGITVSAADTSNPSYSFAGAAQDKDDLGTIILNTVEQLGGRVAIAQLKGKLPPGTVATDQMIRTTVNKHPELTLTGPFVRRL